MKGIADLKNPVAELNYPDSGDLIYAKKAYSGGTYFCPDPNCGDPQRRLFKKRRIRHFFSHYGDYGHSVSGETLLHKSAIKYFKELDEFELPSINGVVEKIKLNSSATKIEYNGLKNIVPDVKLETIDSRPLFVEIFVTNETKEQKILKIGEYKILTVEINLSGFYKANHEKCRSDIDFIKSKIPELIRDPNLKTWLFNPDIIGDETNAQSEELTDQQESIQKEPQSTKELSATETIVIGATMLGIGLAIFPSLRKWLIRLTGVGQKRSGRKWKRN